MTDETADNQDNEALEGEIVDGTWVNPSVPADDARRARAPRSQVDYSLPEGRPSFMRMIFGSVVIFSEEVTERAMTFDDDEAPREMIEAAVNQAVSQEQSIDRRPLADLRYGTIGFISGVLDRAQDGAGRVSGFTDAAARSAGKIIGPLWNSFLFAPLHEPAQRAEQAGEKKVDEWIRRGRVEEVRSRALAEISINNLVEESVSELTENTQVQMLVQEVITNQSTSLASEIFNEIRERFVSLDILLMGKLNRALAPTPEFRAHYLESMAARRSQYGRVDLHNSLAGTYAGPVSRLFAFLFDVLVLMILAGVISSFVSNALTLFGLTGQVNDFLRTGGLISSAAVLFIALFNLILISLYFIISWNLIGSTIGNMLFGIRVVNKEGGRVSFLRAILRLIGGWVSAAVFFLGFIWALFDRRRQGWHDKFGATYVLYDWPAKPEETFLREQVMAEIEEES